MCTCNVCGGYEFVGGSVLWEELITSWQLSPYEVDYIDRQQGLHCVKCGNNLRSIALAKGILDSYKFSGSLMEFAASRIASKLKVLEINEAGNLTPILRQLPGYKFIAYPEFDMMNLKLGSGSFDLVVHSDTLEHIADPVKALSECKRILTVSGKCIFTIPVVVDRLSRSRAGLKPSYHGGKTCPNSAYMVHTEFGMDFWKYVFNAGFAKCKIHMLDYPAAFAIEAAH